MSLSTNQIRNQIQYLMDIFNINNINLNISDNTHTYNDEPKIFHYGSYLKHNNTEILSSGTSFESREEALLKCIGECIERMSLYSLPKENSLIIKNPYSHEEISKYLRDPLLVRRIIAQPQIGWVYAQNLSIRKKILLPAQMIYLNFAKTHREPQITTMISTGAAGAWTKKRSLLTGIYEVVERDAFMTMYLNKIQPPEVDITTIDNSIVKKAIDVCNRYFLRLIVLDITNDLEIPTYLTIVLDDSKFGPPVTVGAKTHLNIIEAITGSINEAITGRKMFKHFMLHKNGLLEEPKHIINLNDRMQFWLDRNKIHHLDFLINPKRIQKITIKHNYIHNDETALTSLIDILKRKKHEVFSVNIGPEWLKKTKYFVNKIIIPTMQPLYFNEQNVELREERLHQVAKYFGYPINIVNRVPHPFI